MGRDCLYLLLGVIIHSFNPRARMGRDLRPDGSVNKIEVSIHAPAWGATAAWWACGKARECFNPRARMGRDRLCVPLP